MTKTQIVYLVIALALPLIGLAVRTWILKEIDKRIQFRFEKELEIVKSDLRLKEGKISALQSMVLSRLAGRQSVIDRRSIEALEALWSATLKLGAFRLSATLITVLDMEKIDQRPQHDESVEMLLKPFVSGDFKEKFEGISAESHRPFIPENIWKIFSAYQGLLIICQMRIQAVATGLRDTDKIFKTSKITDDVKEILPHFTDYLDKFGMAGAAGLVDPLRDLLLEAIRSVIEASGNESSASQTISKMIEEFEQHHRLLA